MVLDKSVHKPAFHKDSQKRKEEFWKKLLLQSSSSVEKVSCTGERAAGLGRVRCAMGLLEFWRSLLGPG